MENKIERELKKAVPKKEIIIDSAALLEPEEAQIFTQWLRILNEHRIPYLVGGAFAVYAYTGIWRDTKDFDIFIQPEDLRAALDALAKDGFETEIRDVLWLAKVHQKPYFMDLIFGTSSNQMPINRKWFNQSLPVEIMGIKTRLTAIEELIASKVFMVKRDRFDGADILHLIRSTQGKIDWERLLADYLKNNREILLFHLILFNFVYPSHTDFLPKELMVSLFEQMREDWSKPHSPRVFRGMLLDPVSFAPDCKEYGYENGCYRIPLVNKEGKLI